MYTGCLKNLNPIAKRNYAINFFYIKKDQTFSYRTTQFLHVKQEHEMSEYELNEKTC